MAEPLAPVPYIYNLIKEGVSASQGLEQYREAGGAIRTQRWYAAYGEVAAELAVAEKVMQAPVERAPTADEVTQRSSSKPGAYTYRVTLLTERRMVDPLTGRTVSISQPEFAMVRSQTLRPYNEVLSQIEAQFVQGYRGAEGGVTVFGSFVTAVNELVAPTN